LCQAAGQSSAFCGRLVNVNVLKLIGKWFILWTDSQIYVWIPAFHDFVRYLVVESSFTKVYSLGDLSLDMKLYVIPSLYLD
jgi:hypothetical protein